MHSLAQRIPTTLTKFIMPLLSVAVALSLGLVAIGSWNTWQISQKFHLQIADDFQLQALSSEIVHLDEVLTMSALMAVATGENRWEERYRLFEPQLEQALAGAIHLAPKTYEVHAVQTNTANQTLVALENEAFGLIRQGDKEQALKTLLSEQYTTQKQIYARGMQETNNILQEGIRANLRNYSKKLERASTFSVFSLCILIVAWILILFMIDQYLNYRKQAERQVHQAKFELEESNRKLQRSQIDLDKKATDLAKTVNDLQQAQLQIVQTEKMSSLGQLVAGIAHEINNPVSFIYGNLSHFKTYTQDLLYIVNLYQSHYPEPAPNIQLATDEIELAYIQEDLPKTLNAINVGTKRIIDIVASLQNFSRMDEVGRKAVNIHEGIDNTLLILQHRLQRSNATSPKIQLDKQYGELPLIECYAGTLNQVFMNLISNAIDAIEDRYANDPAMEGRIVIRTEQIASDYVAVTIADNGCGIPRHIQSKICDPFFTTKPLGKGTGLGMSISYKIIVDQHQGQLNYHSSVGKGTEFIIKIPCHLAHHKPDPNYSAMATAQPAL